MSERVMIPRKLADALDTYYQTSAFAQRNFTKFDKTMTHQKIKDEAAKLHYTVEVSQGKNSGTFIFARPSRKMRVSRKTFPEAEVID